MSKQDKRSWHFGLLVSTVSTDFALPSIRRNIGVTVEACSDKLRRSKRKRRAQGSDQRVVRQRCYCCPLARGRNIGELVTRRLARKEGFTTVSSKDRCDEKPRYARRNATLSTTASYITSRPVYFCTRPPSPVPTSHQHSFPTQASPIQDPPWTAAVAPTSSKPTATP